MALQKMFTECLGGGGGGLRTANVFFKSTQNTSVKYIFGSTKGCFFIIRSITKPNKYFFGDNAIYYKKHSNFH